MERDALSSSEDSGCLLERRRHQDDVRTGTGEPRPGLFECSPAFANREMRDSNVMAAWNGTSSRIFQWPNVRWDAWALQHRDVNPGEIDHV